MDHNKHSKEPDKQTAITPWFFSKEFTMAQTVLDRRGWTVDSVRQGRWTLFSDTASASSDGVTTAAETINTLSGNDIIYGKLSSGTGSQSDPIAGVFIEDGTTLNMGLGDDRITGFGPLINSYEYGIRNEGAIDTGYGNDKLEGTGNDGIFNSGVIKMGDGNDSILGNGTSLDIVNRGSISMGAGRDLLTGLGPTSAIFNSGIIDTGDGNDIVDALTGGFSTDAPATATILLGRGNDVLKGFGANQTFHGGAGTDGLVFLDGTYTVTTAGAGFDIVNNGFPAMRVTGFELISGAATGSASLAAGTYTIAGSSIDYVPFP